MPRQATKATGNRYFEARMRAAKYNEKLLTLSLVHLPVVQYRGECGCNVVYSCLRVLQPIQMQGRRLVA